MHHENHTPPVPELWSIGLFYGLDDLLERLSAALSLLAGVEYSYDAPGHARDRARQWAEIERETRLLNGHRPLPARIEREFAARRDPKIGYWSKLRPEVEE